MNSISVFVSPFFDLDMLKNSGVKHVWNYKRDGNVTVLTSKVIISLDLSNCRLPYRKVYLFSSKMQLSSPGDHISIVFSVKLPLKLIWLKVSSAFNIGQRQQWNFPSLSCGA